MILVLDHTPLIRFLMTSQNSSHTIKDKIRYLKSSLLKLLTKLSN